MCYYGYDVVSAKRKGKIEYMKNILIHGLGQNEGSWYKIRNILSENDIQVETPNLFELARNYQLTYENLYRNFADYCNSFGDKLNLVGLSLGGILTIDYAIEYPEKVNSIILSGTPYEIPKGLFMLQNIIYRFMPKKVFAKIGCPKDRIIDLMKSMSKLEIPEKVKKIKCKTLIICGEKEQNNVNMKSARQLNADIINSQFKIIKNAGHEINIEQPKEFADIVLDFFYKEKEIL